MNATNINFLTDTRTVEEIKQEPAHQAQMKLIAAIRKGLLSRSRILADPKEQEFLRKHIALGIPMWYIAGRFGMTVPQTWALIRELGII